MNRDDTLKELIESIDPELLLDREGFHYKVTAGSRGAQLNVQDCPSCGDHNWKVYLNAESGLGNCFKCDAKFNLFSFVKAHVGNGKDAVELLKSVAAEQGYRPIAKPAPVVRRTDFELPDSVPIPYLGQNLRYLEERGIRAETAQYFGLRYCAVGHYLYLLGNEAKTVDFSQRVLFPVHDLDGTMKTFQGRDVTGLSPKKYLFPSGLAGSGVFLYNGHNAIGAKSIVIGEGVFDVMAIKQAFDTEPDLRDVVPIGTFGKHLGCNGGNDIGDQCGRLLQLRRMGLENITFMWDGTKDALVAAVKSAEKLARLDFKVRVAKLPQDCDPNEVSPEAVVYAYYHAKPFSNRLHAMAVLGEM
jgi:DNA primase